MSLNEFVSVGSRHAVCLRRLREVRHSLVSLEPGAPATVAAGDRRALRAVYT